MYEKRVYRDKMQADGLVYYRVVEYETDLLIASETDQTDLMRRQVHETRKILENYGEAVPEFFTALEPIPVLQCDPTMNKRMKTAAAAVGVGPMAAVAGAVYASVGGALLKQSKEVIVENGGDLFIKTDKIRRVAIEAGRSAFKDLALKIKPAAHPIGICTSSGTVGHSLSFGRADAATVISEDVYLSDAAATALGNRVRTHEDMAGAIEWIKGIAGIKGVLIIVDNRMGAWGEIELD